MDTSGNSFFSMMNGEKVFQFFQNSIKMPCFIPILSFSQVASTKNNGQIDDVTEFATIMTVPFTMPDGIKLATDVYLPLLSDCLLYTLVLDTNIFSFPLKDSFEIEFIKKGTQIVMYDSITPPDTLSTYPLKLKWNYYDPQNLIKNPNPYQMPVILTRTPYDKTGEDAMALMTLLGHAAVMQDMRGRYASEGVYMPMYSDSWDKTPYHPTWGHVLDRQTPLTDPRHGNKHEDGYNTVRYIAGEYDFDPTMDWLKDDTIIYDIDLDGDMDTITNNNKLTRVYDYNFDGVPDTFVVATPNVGTFGASALGNTQYQEAAAHKIDTLRAGLKCLLPIVATNEHFKYTGYQNGVFRDRIVTGWVKGQIFTGVDDDCDTCLVGGSGLYRAMDAALGNPGGVHNTLHTSYDYGNGNKFDAANEAIDHFTMWRPNSDFMAGYYPNSNGRADMDGSRAMLNATTGEGDANGTLSRYTNMDVPAYHLFGWWDIFVDGQIETNNLMRKYASKKNRGMQKMVIGPWAHQTIGSTETGDQEYPDNIYESLGLDLSDVGGDTLPLTDIFSSDIVSWYRHNLNYSKGLGEPKIFIPASTTWQKGGGTQNNCGVDSILIPYEDYAIPFEDFINFLSGYSALPPITIKVAICNNPNPGVLEFEIPANPESLLPGLASTEIKPPKDKDFSDFSVAPPVRFYVVGDGLDNTVGNYWFAADSFPLINGIEWTKTYLHQDGSLNETAPQVDEGYKIYVHDPDDPVLTTGGANMIVRTPQDDRNSQGQMNLADPLFAPYSMNRTGVISFTGDPIEDSLCIIGFPVATIFAKSNPGGVTDGPTDTDFFIRVLDVFPDGRELFVHEGCVNARGRAYARGIVHGADGKQNYYHGFPSDEPADGIDDIPFSNIEVGRLYEYKFKMMPIAYTWGAGHRMKVLISSSNYTRYQVNPNLPIEDGEFFRRKPGDGQSYVYQGVEMYPRVAVQRIAFSPEFPTNIDLPVYNPLMVPYAVEDNNVVTPILDALVYPNPATDNVSIYMSQIGKYRVELMNISGQTIFNKNFTDHIDINLGEMQGGLYLVKIEDIRTGEQIVEKISIR